MAKKIYAPEELYTPEGLPIVSKKVSDEVKRIVKDRRALPFQVGFNLHLYLTHQNQVLLEYQNAMLKKLCSGQTQGTPEPDISYRIGFFEPYQLLRKQGMKERKRNLSFEGIPCLESEVVLDVMKEFDDWNIKGQYNEIYSQMLEQISNTNPELYNHGVTQMKDIKIRDNKEVYLTGFFSVIELLRRGQVEASKKESSLN